MKTVLTTFTLGVSFQVRRLGRSVDTYFSLISAPFFTIIFLSMILYSGRSDLASYAVVAPTLMTLWTAALMFSGEMISEDRENGRLELLVAAPASLPTLVFGRLCGAMLISLPAFALSILLAGVLFDFWITIHHPVMFVTAVLSTALSTAATATALTSLFIAAPGARIVQNTLSMPMFLLSGVLVPVSLFPWWLEGLSRVLYLSWGADLLRDSLSPEPLEAAVPRLFMVVFLGALALTLGYVTLVRFLRSARAEGTLSRS